MLYPIKQVITNRQLLNYKLSQTWEPSHEQLMTVINGRWAIANKRSKLADWISFMFKQREYAEWLHHLLGGNLTFFSKRFKCREYVYICFCFEIHDFIQNTQLSQNIWPCIQHNKFKPSSKTTVIWSSSPVLLNRWVSKDWFALQNYDWSPENKVADTGMYTKAKKSCTHYT